MEFLLELLAEELPASHIRSAFLQLEERFRSELTTAGIDIGSLATLGTARRLIVVGDLASGQQDSEEIVTGPPRAVAIDADGVFTKAAKGFGRAQGIPETSLEIIETPRGEYLGFRKTKKGKPTTDILRDIVPRILSSLSFPKMMRWGSGQFRFSRPLHGLLCLFDGKPMAVSFENLKAGDMTWGHRIFKPGKIKVRSFAEYKERLQKAWVIVDPKERKRQIQTEIKEKLAPLKARVHADPELLDELVMNVEHPLVILGKFPQEYLDLPLEVLSTAMRAGQKLFSVVKDKKQIPYFVGVADACKDPRGFIQKGNERVLKARLEDARFFWEQDKKIPLAERAEGLQNVIFQEKLGSYEDKCQRLKMITAYIGDKTDLGKAKKDVVEAAGLCKADLLTEMVKEFPGLQGIMGGLYARQEGYPPSVCQAVYEHYQPSGLDDTSPASMAGAVLSIADKLDSIVGVIGTGFQVTGSSDPFGLRRSAHGVCKTILDRKLCFSFFRLVDKILSVYGDKLTIEKDDIKSGCLEFFEGRLRFILDKKGFRYDLISASLGPGIDVFLRTLQRAEALDKLKSSPHFAPFILMVRRINNIIREKPFFKVNPEFFVEKEERELYSSFSIVKNNVRPMIARGDFSQAQGIIFRLQPVLNTFFDKILVMAEEKRLRRNRLGLLQAINEMLDEMADYSQIVLEGDKPAEPAGSH